MKAKTDGELNEIKQDMHGERKGEHRKDSETEMKCEGETRRQRWKAKERQRWKADKGEKQRRDKETKIKSKREMGAPVWKWKKILADTDETWERDGWAWRKHEGEMSGHR